MERVVLGVRRDTAWCGFQWTGAEPEGIYEASEALALGARWEGEELVTYDLPALAHAVRHHHDGYLADAD